MRNPFSKFVAPVVNFIDRVKQMKVVQKLKNTKVETGRGGGGGGKFTSPKVSLTNREVAYIRLQKVTYWKKVMKRRLRKGRAIKKPTNQYYKALGSL